MSSNLVTKLEQIGQNVAAFIENSGKRHITRTVSDKYAQFFAVDPILETFNFGYA